VSSGDFADIYTKLEGKADQNDADRWLVVQRDLKAEYAAWQADNPQAKEPPALAELWEIRFKQSPQYAQYVVARLAQAPATTTNGSSSASVAKPAKVSQPRQLSILARRYLDLIVQDRRNLIILLLQAPIIGILLALVAKGDAIVGANAYANEAKKILFMLATVGVWFGIINAAREIAKEAPIYRRERLANLHILPYVSSKTIILTLLLIVQSIILLVLVGLKVQFPETGVILPIWAELFITTTLTAMAGLAMGLVISAFASTPDRAISIVPLALIPQILFAGVIFSLGDGITAQRVLSWFTVSRWAMDAYGTSVNLNELPIQPRMFPDPSDQYTFSASHLLSRWMILIGYTVICLGLTGFLLKRRDER
jgi:hypothetical protein